MQSINGQKEEEKEAPSLEVLVYWPTTLDGTDYFPDRAIAVMEATRKAPDELLDASWACDGYAAEIDAELRRN